ncbi:hypothetical protein [Haloarcula onubensis]|uniref:Uncharacterized protein n=1 Tax=Haloarcula onubensis TaxID=2950539 RepID=A0ABU2FSD3_9EURY|nr:hypothetical protein [Halomicroarcula sp. S3CR25-11]MDS0283678.1 hypothetical protein [Halomicroarcula sp. S3CR25-11]
MIGPLLRRFLSGTTGDDSGDASGDSGDDAGFAGSVLDWSVNYGHGPDGGQQEAAREMAEIQATAERLEAQDRHRR